MAADGGSTKPDAAKQGVAASQKSVEQGQGELSRALLDALQAGIAEMP